MSEKTPREIEEELADVAYFPGVNAFKVKK
jgi:hypothetical protein